MEHNEQILLNDAAIRTIALAVMATLKPQIQEVVSAALKIEMDALDDKVQEAIAVKLLPVFNNSVLGIVDPILDRAHEATMAKVDDKICAALNNFVDWTELHDSVMDTVCNMSFNISVER